MYSRVIAILDEYFKDHWFLDSGSLLGIVRDGKFLASDVGIDISVIIDSHHNPNIEECVKKLNKEGLVVSRIQALGRTYKYCLVPKKGNSIPFAFDLHLFVQCGDNYLCPNMKMPIQSKNKIAILMWMLRAGGAIKKIEKGIIGVFEKLFIHLYRDIFEYFGQPSDHNKNVSDENVYKWVIPCSLFRGVEREDLYGFNVLKDCDDYLTYRYGNWRIPVTDWVTMRDDGGFKKSNLKELNEILDK
jgi:hypothetical protein